MRFVRCISLAVLILVMAVASGAQQKSRTAHEQRVVDTVKTIFVAAKEDDLEKFNSVVVPGYYMFDEGKRFDGDAIMKLIRDMHAKGIRYEWTVVNPDVHISGNTAWIAYQNRGIITDQNGKSTTMAWLESAFLEKRHGVWKIVFFHSTREAPPPAAGQ